MITEQRQAELYWQVRANKTPGAIIPVNNQEEMDFITGLAVKHDAGKPPLHLIDPIWLETTARVLEFGAKKYSPWNWAKGTFDWSQLYSAAMRHLQAFWAGEENDPETGMPHIWHANCCLMFLTRYVRDGLGTDDRPKCFSTAWASQQTLHYQPGAESLQSNVPGGGTGGDGGGGRTPVRGEFGAGTGEDGDGSRLGYDAGLHVKRALDEATEQQARPVLHTRQGPNGRPGDYGFDARLLQSPSNDGGSEEGLSSSELPTGDSSAGQGDSGGQAEPDRSSRKHSLMGTYRETEHLQSTRDSTPLDLDAQPD